MAPLVAFYGDDLTGSVDTLAVLTEGGLNTLLFLLTPSLAEQAAAGPLDAIGIAGAARTMSPAQMDGHLPAVFDALKATGARLVQYKVCSTFDSSPTVGNIAHAIALARPRFRRGFVPVVVGQPGIDRYCSFGNLYGAVTTGGAIYRLDRHPGMSRHPVTPMDEADLRLVLARQGLSRVGLVDIRQLRSAGAQAVFAGLLAEAPDAVLFDVLEESDFRLIGALIGGALEAGEPVFGVGFERVAAGAAGRLGTACRRPSPGRAIAAGAAFGGGADRLRQPLAGGRGTGRGGGARRLRGDRVAAAAPRRSRRRAGHHRRSGGRGGRRHRLRPQRHRPHQPGARRPARVGGISREALDRLARSCGLLAQAVRARMPLRRLGFAGGDTSTFAAQAMGVRALAFDFRLAPGVAMCKVRASGELDGMQVMLRAANSARPTSTPGLPPGSASNTHRRKG